LLRNFVATGPRELEGAAALDSASWGPIMAASTPYTILPGRFFLIVQRRMAGGLVAGSVQG
jgi:ABC-type glycerol-3-phosphate transport system permease component